MRTPERRSETTIMVASDRRKARRAPAAAVLPLMERAGVVLPRLTGSQP